MIAFIFPLQPLDVAPVERILTWVKEYFKGLPEIVFAAPAASISHYQKTFPMLDVRLYSRAECERDYDKLVFLEGTYHISKEEHFADNLQDHYAKPVYSVRCSGKISLVNGQIDSTEFEHLEKHVFNRLSNRTGSTYYYFPYGYLFRYTGMGPINELGFRIPFDFLSLKARPANHKVVCVYGGSAAYGLRAFHHEMFPFKLETMLNEFCASSGRDLRFSVLNFSQLSHCVLNEMFTYMLFSSLISPEFVITHDGYNDMILGMNSDPFLLENYSVTYQDAMEQWAQILHKTEGLPRTQNSVPYEILSLPQTIIDSYILRKKQFRDLVENGGGKFIWGLQPCLASKKSLSAREQSMEPLWLNDHIHSKDFEQIPFLYGEMVRLMAYDGIDLVSTHEHFRQYGSDENLFDDPVHMTPEGETRVAEFYFNHFKQNILSQP